MKIYVHKRLLLSFFVMLVLCVFCWFLMQDEQYSFKSVFCFCCVTVLAVVFLAMQWQYRTHKNWELAMTNSRKVIVEFTDDAILFPYRYHFKWSSISKERIIHEGRINEILPDTYPQSIVVDGKEIVFLDNNVKSRLTFAERNNIPVAKRIDIRYYILEPFLDTELEPGEKVRNMEILSENGVLPTEVNAIRRGCSSFMFLNTYFSLEWEYYGHYDYIRQAVMTEKQYWKSMEIALRNYIHGQ
jgi:hypothetical protein